MRKLSNRLMLFAGICFFFFPFIVGSKTSDFGQGPEISYWGQWKSSPVESFVFGILQQVYNVGGWFAFYWLNFAWLSTGIFLVYLSIRRTNNNSSARELAEWDADSNA